MKVNVRGDEGCPSRRGNQSTKASGVKEDEFICF